MLFLRISNKFICVFENKMKKEWRENQFLCQPSAAGSSPAASAWPPATQSPDRQTNRPFKWENLFGTTTRVLHRFLFWMHSLLYWSHSLCLNNCCKLLHFGARSVFWGGGYLPYFQIWAFHTVRTSALSFLQHGRPPKRVNCWAIRKP